ncbi:MAG TPA: glycosyltransferase family A protein [Gemmatimonadales bacterium]
MSNSEWGLSIIIEWDNVRLSEMRRCREMLRTVGRQAAELCDRAGGTGLLGRLRCPIHLLVTYNEEEIDVGSVRQVVEEEMAPYVAHLAVQYLSEAQGSYYSLKNLAAANATGDILLFIDSDVIPEHGWLVALVSSFEDPAVQIVGGHAYIDAHSLYERAVALTWFFPRRVENGALEKYHRFFANNFAVRAGTFRRFPFPEPKDGARTAGIALRETLRRNGIDLYRNSMAQVRHPAPNGLHHFLQRAIAHGRDDAVVGRTTGVRQRWLRHLLRSYRAVLLERNRVGLSVIEIPAALVIGTVYWVLAAISAGATRVAPSFMARHFRL